MIHVRHDSTEPDSPLRDDRARFAFQPGLAPADGEADPAKSANPAFVGTDPEAPIRERGHERLVIAGLTTDHCVSTTARMAENLGFAPTVVADATATHERAYDGSTFDAETVHRTASASLRCEFAAVRSTADVLTGVRSDE